MKLNYILLLFCLLYTLHLSAQTQVGQNIIGDDPNDRLGDAVSISADGMRLAMGAPSNDENGTDAGLTKIFEWNNEEWTQLGEDILGEYEGDLSGESVALSADGNTVAIGAIKNNENDVEAGHTRIFEWNNDEWTQLGQDIDGENEGDKSSHSVSLSEDGSRVIIGVIGNDDNGPNAGQAKIFEWNNNEWTQLGQDINGENEGDECGFSVSISADGNRVAIGARYNTEVIFSAGHTRVYEWGNNQWTQLGEDIDGENSHDKSGSSVSISGDGNHVAIGAPRNTDNGQGTGQTRIFEWTENEWLQVGEDINGLTIDESSGTSVALSADGNTVAIGSPQGLFIPNSTGITRIYSWDNNSWTQIYEDIFGEDTNDYSYHVSISGDGNLLAIGAPQSDENGNNSGNVRVFDITKPNLTSNDLCFTLDYSTSQTQYILEGDFTNCNIFILDENENVVQFLLNFSDKIIINLDELPDGLHFIRVEHQQYDELFVQEIIKQ